MKLIVAALIVVAGLAGALAQTPDPPAENVLIEKANAAVAARKWQDAENLLKQLIVMAPQRAAYRTSLANAQGNLGRYRDAVASYDMAIALAEKYPADAGAGGKAFLAAAFTGKANMLLKLKDNPAAVAAYERAAQVSADPAAAYFNLCATFYNSGEVKGALAACEKAIAADANKADAYFIKGSVLIADSTTDKSGKLVAPPAALQALRKYLALAPNGAHAKDVNEMLAAVGASPAPKNTAPSVKR